jgi:hypothetical protein
MAASGERSQACGNRPRRKGMTDEFTDQVSAGGAERRKRMLPELMQQMKQVHRARRVRRRAVAVTVPVLVVVLSAVAWQVVSRPSAHQPHESAANSNPFKLHDISQHQAPGPTVSIVRVQTNPGIVERYRAASVPRAIVLDDDALLVALADLNRPAGLIRSEGRVWLTADVIDAPADGSGS